MAFNQMVVKNAFTGAATAYTSPLNAMNGAIVALNTKTTGSITSSAGLVIPCAGPQWNIEWDSLAALVETRVTTTSLVVVTRWEYSPDGTNWVPIFGLNAATNVQQAATGTGSLVTTQYFQAFAGINPGCGYIRLAVVNTGATGGSGDNVVASYFFRKRWTT